jgi:hypothetical protein
MGSILHFSDEVAAPLSFPDAFFLVSLPHLPSAPPVIVLSLATFQTLLSAHVQCPMAPACPN